MAPKSMVDALTVLKKHLKPNGLLIDIHPYGHDVPLHVQLDNTTHQVGLIDITSKVAKYHRAEEAIQTALRNSLYKLQQETVVRYHVYFDTVTACQQYLAEEWSSAQLPDESWQKMSRLMKTSAQFKQICYVEDVKFYSLSPTQIGKL